MHYMGIQSKKLWLFSRTGILLMVKIYQRRRKTPGLGELSSQWGHWSAGLERSGGCARPGVP